MRLNALPKVPPPQKPPKVSQPKAPEFANAVNVAAIEKPRAVFRPPRSTPKMVHWSGH